MITYMTLEDANGEQVALHGPDLPARRLTGAQGLPGVLGMAAPRDSSYAAPGRHGSITRTRFQSSSLITLEGLAIGSTPDEALAQMVDVKTALSDAIDTTRLLRYQRGTDGTGVELQTSVRLAGDVREMQDAAGRVIRWQASLRGDDPRAYTQQLVTATSGPLVSAGGIAEPIEEPIESADPLGAVVAAYNSGARPTPPTFRVYGLAGGAQILLVGTGKRIVLTGTIPAGQYAVIDVAGRTVTINGNRAQGMVVSASTSWFDLPRGHSIARLLALTSDAGARLEVDYRPAY